MGLHDLLRVAQRNIVLLLALILVGGVVALGYSFVQQPQYAATSRAFVATGAASSVQDLSQANSFTVQAVESYAQVASTPYVLNRVATDLHLHESAAHLAPRVSASADAATVILTITATDNSPRRAAAIANSVTSELAKAVGELTPTANAQSQVKITQIQPASAPSSPVSPNTALNVLVGVLAGLILAIAASAAREVLDTRVRGSHDLDLVSENTLMGSIGYSSELRQNPGIVSRATSSALAESFRALRTNLAFLDYDKGARTIVVTSSVAGEGKSTTTVNLAVAVSDAGKTVLAIDADLRRPKLGTYFGIDESVGLTDVLIGTTTLSDAIQPWGDAGLMVLPAGRRPPNPSELLQSEAMNTLLARVREEYDFVLLDAPPVLPATDATILTRECDGALMVAGAKKVRRGQLRSALQNVERAGGRVLGTILTMAATRGPDAYYYGYGSYSQAGDGRTE